MYFFNLFFNFNFILIVLFFFKCMLNSRLHLVFDLKFEFIFYFNLNNKKNYLFIAMHAAFKAVFSLQFKMQFIIFYLNLNEKLLQCTQL